MLIKKKSKMPKSGDGLFTDEPIEKNVLISEYFGEIISFELGEKRILAGRGGYVLNTPFGYCIDARKNLKCLARYANDAAGPMRAPGQRNNAKFTSHKKKIYIVSTRKIRAGEEICIPYGQEYWKVHEEVLQNLKKKLKLKKQLL